MKQKRRDTGEIREIGWENIDWEDKGTKRA